ncbi:MAG TPA: hypothetical protein VM783_12720 [Candidatus Acidoferrum sp.]|nr:hypothetical protein [Candidatus Acidoferrum sp.]
MSERDALMHIKPARKLKEPPISQLTNDDARRYGWREVFVWRNLRMQSQSTGFRIIGFTVAVCLFAIATRGGAQTKFESLHVGYSAQEGSLAPIWITKEAGIFKKHGLDVELLFIPGGPTAAAALFVWRGSYFGRRRASHCKQ